MGNRKWLVYTITFIAYALSHFSRKSYTYVKKEMKEEDGMDVQLLGRLDSTFMFAYAIGSFLSGNLGDRLNPAAVVSTGLCGAAVCVLLLVYGLWSKLLADSYLWGNVFFIGIWILHGLFQSTGGPVNTAIMGNWFSAKNRGLIFGTWTCHQYVGNIVGALVASAILSSHIHYYWALLIAVASNLIWAFVVCAFLPVYPEETEIENLPLSTEPQEPKTEASHSNHAHHLPPPITISAACRIPAVTMYAIAFGFFKLTNYTLFFWLPFYLTKYFSPATSNLISMLYDFGMMPGGIITGYLSDLFGGRRACVCVTMLIFLCPLLFLFSQEVDSMSIPMLLSVMLLMGLLVGGPNNIITSAVAADLALHPSIRGNHRALGTVTGIINGSGSITAAIGLMLVTWLQKNYSWTAVWYFLIWCTISGCGFLGPKVFRELRQKSDYMPIP